MTANLTARADALVEGVLKRTIHVHYSSCRLTIGRPHALELEVELHLLPWRAQLVRASWCQDEGGHACFGGSACGICLSARVAMKLHGLARRLRRLQKREEDEWARVEKEEARKQRLTRLLRVLGRAEERLAQKAAEELESPER